MVTPRMQTATFRTQVKLFFSWYLSPFLIAFGYDDRVSAIILLETVREIFDDKSYNLILLENDIHRGKFHNCSRYNSVWNFLCNNASDEQLYDVFVLFMKSLIDSHNFPTPMKIMWESVLENEDKIDVIQSIEHLKEALEYLRTFNAVTQSPLEEARTCNRLFIDSDIFVKHLVILYLKFMLESVEDTTIFEALLVPVVGSSLLLDSSNIPVAIEILS